MESPEAVGLVLYAWSADGETLLFVHLVPDADISTVAVGDDGSWETLIQTQFNEGNPAVSADGKWIAYQSDESGEWEIYAQRFPELGDRQQISIGGGRGPQWSRSGQELFYRRPDGNAIMAVPISDTGSRLSLGTPQLLFEGVYVFAGASRNYDVAPDGTRFLMLKPGALAGESAV